MNNSAAGHGSDRNYCNSSDSYRGFFAIIYSGDFS